MKKRGEANEKFYKYLNANGALDDVVSVDSGSTIIDVDEITGSIKYTTCDDDIRGTIHVGQLKLLLSEIQFLSERPLSLVVYVGSAPSQKAVCLAELFPTLKIIMIDPGVHYVPEDDITADEGKYVYFKCQKHGASGSVRMFNGREVFIADRDSDEVSLAHGEFNLAVKRRGIDEWIRFVMESRYTFFIWEDFFGSASASAIAACREIYGDMLFISDIRSKTVAGGGPSDLDVLWNSAMQYNWLRELQPAAAMLKFRTPYHDKRDKSVSTRSRDQPYAGVFADAYRDIDFVGNYSRAKFVYLDGELRIQAFAPLSSTESRLVIDRTASRGYTALREYDPVAYENSFFYYNRVWRPYKFHEHSLIDAKAGIDGCADCALMAHILAFIGDAEKIKAYIARVMGVIGRSFIEDHHGGFLRAFRNFAEIIDRQRQFF